MHFRVRFAVEGQRPANKPAQGNALGLAQSETPALKGRHRLLRPFRAGSISTRYSVTGTQMSDTKEAIVLKSPDGQLSTYEKATIKSMTQPVGVMPPVKLFLTTRELRDLIAFLSTLQLPK